MSIELTPRGHLRPPKIIRVTYLPELPALTIDGGELLELLSDCVPVDVALHQLHQLHGVVQAQVAQRTDCPLQCQNYSLTK